MIIMLPERGQVCCIVLGWFTRVIICGLELSPELLPNSRMTVIAQTEPPAKFSCDGRENGYYPEKESNCRKFYRCYNSIRFDHWCPKNQAFDLKGETCSPKSLVECSDAHQQSCIYKQDGYYPNLDNECKTFIRCVNREQVLISSCPEGMKFDMRTQACSAEPSVSCGRPSCEGLENGQEILLNNDCHSFFVCQSGTARLQRCPPDTAFSVTKKKCSSDAVENCGSPDCSNKEQGYHIDFNDDCRSYYYCSNKMLISRTLCSGDLLFNGHKCVKPSSFKCSSNKEDKKCKDKGDGFYADVENDCHSYFYCMSSAVISYKTCSNNKVFDGTMCVFASNYQCKDEGVQFRHASTTLMDECYSKSDGFHWFPTEGCRKYYRCVSGRMMASYSCEIGKVFSGAFCVEESTFSCPLNNQHQLQTLAITDSNLCVGKPNGYHVMAGTDCQNYYECLNGERIGDTLSCLPFTSFDVVTQSCQPSEVVTSCGNQPVSLCLNKPDGYHTVPETNCNQYFYCKNNNQLGPLISCPNNNAFDVSAKECRQDTQCFEGPGGFNCRDKPDGYYPAEAKSCQSIFVCENGRVSHITCPKRQAVNINTLTCEENANFVCPFKGRNICLGRDPGIYEDYLSDCKGFSICGRNGEVLNGVCPQQKTFNSITKFCQNEGIVKCSPVKVTAYSNNNIQVPVSSFSCKGRVGFFPDYESNCQSYFICLPKGKQVVQHCASNFLFDVSVGLCRPSVSVSCKPQTSNQACNQEGQLIPSRDKDCRKWLKCVNNKYELYECLEYERFDWSTKSCKSMYSVPCPQARKTSNAKQTNTIEVPQWLKTRPINLPFSVTSALRSGHVNKVMPPLTRQMGLNQREVSSISLPFLQTPKLPTTSRSDFPIPCANRPDGMYANEDDGCETFHVCMLGTSKSHACPQGELFDQNIRACRNKNNVVCGNKNTIDMTVEKQSILDTPPKLNINVNNSLDVERSGKQKEEIKFTCSMDSIKYYADYDNKCQTFRVCSHGRIKRYECPSKLRFNPVSHTCDFANNVICEPWFSELCSDVENADKHHLLPGSECQSYYRCNNKKVKLYRCPRGTLFDTKSLSCIRDYQVECQAHSST